MTESFIKTRILSKCGWICNNYGHLSKYRIQNTKLWIEDGISMLWNSSTQKDERHDNISPIQITPSHPNAPTYLRRK
jgi:hypothetical protein